MEFTAQGESSSCWYRVIWGNFKWFIVACAGGSCECCHICMIWMTSFGGFSCNPIGWIRFEIFGALTVRASGGFVNHEEATVCRWKWLAIVEMAVAFLEETCHTSTEANTAIWPSDERRRLLMCCQRCYSAKYEAFIWVGTLQSAQLDGELKQ